MKYISTRGHEEALSFTDVLLRGLAPDGGLYVPAEWPAFAPGEWRALAGQSYAEIAFAILRRFADIPDDELRAILRETYAVPNFDHAAIAPLTQLGPSLWLAELFHGPSLSFKDYALQLIGRLFDRALKAEGKHITIVGATSGDTGSAAIAAVANSPHVTLFMLHPKGRVSDVQRLQMTTVDAPNIHNIAIEGSFDDCQALVKQLFADVALREQLNLSAVNSINWARILAQTVYYAATALALGARDDRKISYFVPTGNFGNVYAGWVAKRLGLPIGRLTVATNANDILTRFFAAGAMEKHAPEFTLSPAMDIQVSSNFERYLLELTGQDAAAVAAMMDEFSRTGRYTLPSQLLAQAQADFASVRCSDDETLAAMRRAANDANIVIDPHTAVALHAARRAPADGLAIILSTAHPAKFPGAVQRAIGRNPLPPAALADLASRAERLAFLPADLTALKDFLRQKS